MNHRPKDKRLVTPPIPHQQKLDFARSARWQQLPRSDQQTCRQSLARLLCQVISQTSQENEDEREDPIATS